MTARCAVCLTGVVDGLPGVAADRIVERAQGIPLYAIETVRGLADRGVLERGMGAWSRWVSLANWRSRRA